MWQFFLDNYQVETFASILGLLLTITVGSSIAWYKSRRARRLFKSGAHFNVLVPQQVIVERKGDRNYVLFRNITPTVPLLSVFPSAESIDYVMQLARKTSSDNPVLNLQGQEGGFVLSTLINFVTGSTAACNFPLSNVMMFVCCDGTSVGKSWGGTKIRIYLIEARDLPLFLDAKFCSDIWVEQQGHMKKIRALLKLASLAEDDKAAMRANAPRPGPNRPGLRYPVTRIVQVALRKDWKGVACRPLKGQPAAA